MALSAPNPSFEGTFLWRPFLSAIPAVLLLLLGFATDFGPLLLPLLAAISFTAAVQLHSMAMTGYAHAGLFRAEFMRGGPSSFWYWFHFALLAIGFVGFSAATAWVAVLSAI